MSSNGGAEAVEAREALSNDPLENVTDGAASGGGGAKLRNRKHGGKDRSSSHKSEDDSSRRDRREQQQQQEGAAGGAAVGGGAEGGGGGGRQELNNPLQADNNPPNNEGGEQEEQQEQQQDAASEGVQGDSKKDEDAKRDEEFVKEAIASVLFAQLDQIEAEGLDRLARKDTTDGSPSKNKAEKKKATGDDKKAAADVKTPAPSKVLPAYFRQSIYWPPYKRTLANITSLPVVEVAMDKTAELHDRLKGVVIFGTLYRFNVWWVAYLRDCAQEALRMFRKTNQRLTPPVFHDVLVWMERKFWELIRWADKHISMGLEWVEDNYPIVTHTPSEIYADGKDKIEQALDWIQSFWIFNNSLFAWARKTLGLGELKPAVEQKKDSPAAAAAAAPAVAAPAAEAAAAAQA